MLQHTRRRRPAVRWLDYRTTLYWNPSVEFDKGGTGHRRVPPPTHRPIMTSLSKASQAGKIVCRRSTVTARLAEKWLLGGGRYPLRSKEALRKYRSETRISGRCELTFFENRKTLRRKMRRWYSARLAGAGQFVGQIATAGVKKDAVGQRVSPSTFDERQTQPWSPCRSRRAGRRSRTAPRAARHGSCALRVAMPPLQPRRAPRSSCRSSRRP